MKLLGPKIADGVIVFADVVVVFADGVVSNGDDDSFSIAYHVICRLAKPFRLGTAKWFIMSNLSKKLISAHTK